MGKHYPTKSYGAYILRIVENIFPCPLLKKGHRHMVYKYRRRRKDKNSHANTRQSKFHLVTSQLIQFDVMQTQSNVGFLLDESNNEILRNLNKEPILLGGNYASLSLIIQICILMSKI